MQAHDAQFESKETLGDIMESTNKLVQDLMSMLDDYKSTYREDGKLNI